MGLFGTSKKDTIEQLKKDKKVLTGISIGLAVGFIGALAWALMK